MAETITEKLQRVLQTMTNDDTSSPRSPNRERFVERSNLLIECISELNSPPPQSHVMGSTAHERIARIIGDYVDLSDSRYSQMMDYVLDEVPEQSSDPQMVGWQDISTAPKTGEEFIARTGPEWSSFSCAWDGAMFVHYDRDDGIIAYGPKQWMPMPGPEAAPESPTDQMVVGEGTRHLNIVDGKIYVFVSEADGLVTFKREGRETLRYLSRDEWDKRFFTQEEMR